MIYNGYEDDRLVVLKVLGAKRYDTGAAYALVKMKESGNEVITDIRKVLSKLAIKEKWIEVTDNSTGSITIYEDVADMHAKTSIPPSSIRRCLRESGYYMKKNLTIKQGMNCKMSTKQIEKFMNNKEE